ncbi:MAG: polysaccharide deacetylase family protein [Atopobiaceae bacterium]|nr:polysaccharide deacetylase family protein [Atopobiaceae bacterium]
MATKEHKNPDQPAVGSSPVAGPVRAQQAGSRFTRSDTGTVISSADPYRSSENNPYLSSGEADGRFSRVHTGYVSAGHMGTTQARTRRRPHHLRNFLIFAVFAAAVAAGGWFVWNNRPVGIVVGGYRRSVTVGTTLAQIKDMEGIETTPGNYVSVSGNVMREGEGNPFTAIVNDEPMPYEQAKDYGVTGGEQIQFADGDDIIEPYDVEVVETQPKLVMDGDWGSICYISSWGRVHKQEVRTGRESGETAPGDVIEQGSDCVIRVCNVQPSDGRKLVALTFDDGPSTYTQQYLDILARYGAKATFFCLGENIESYPDQAKAIVAAGHQIANHTYSHDQLTAVPADTVLWQLTTGFQCIKDATGVDTSVIRPPYGELRQSTWSETNGTVSVSVLWNMDSLDWTLPGADAIVTNATSGIQTGYVILMHDGGGNRDQDVEALPRIIETLQQQGYEFVTISELMASDESIPEECAAAFNPMPEDTLWTTELG